MWVGWLGVGGRQEIWGKTQEPKTRGRESETQAMRFIRRRFCLRGGGGEGGIEEKTLSGEGR